MDRLGVALMALEAGDRAPAFALESDDGKRVSLAGLAGRTVVLYFYPKDMTPGCTIEACDFRDSLARLAKLGAVVLGVSKDPIESHRKFAAKHGLGFALLADVDGEVCEKYGVWQMKSLYGRKFMGIVRTTFVLEPHGRGHRVARVFDKVKVKGHVDQVIQALAEIGGASQ